MGQKRIIPGLVLDNRYPLLYEMDILAGTLTYPGNQSFAARYGLAVYGGFAYHVGSDNRLLRLDIANPATQSVLAGQPTAGETDGTGAAAQFNAPFDLVSDGAGALYVADRVGGTIRKVVISTGAVTTLASGLGTLLGICLSTDGQYLFFTSSTAANGVRKLKLSDNAVSAVAAAPAGANFYGLRHTRHGLILVSSDYFNAGVTCGLYRITDPLGTPGTPTLIVGGATGYAEGTGTTARFTKPLRLAVGRNDVMAYVGEVDGHRIRQINLDTLAVTTLVGSGTAGDVAGTGAGAQIRAPGAVAFDAAGAALYSISSSPATAGRWGKTV